MVEGSIIRQYRYYGDGHASNYPPGLTKKQLTDDNIFSGLGSISQLGIQGRPGTVIYLNGQTFPIVLGETGIYEIDLQNYGQIYSIQFGTAELENYALNKDRLLIDFIYKGGL